jgi:actin
MDYEKELQEYHSNPDKKKDFDLPDGTKVKVGDVIMKTPECLFKPAMLGMDIPGVHQAIYNCV